MKGRLINPKRVLDFGEKSMGINVIRWKLNELMARNRIRNKDLAKRSELLKIRFIGFVE